MADNTGKPTMRSKFRKKDAIIYTDNNDNNKQFKGTVTGNERMEGTDFF